MKKIFFILILLIACNQSKEEANIFFLKGNVALKDKNFKKAIDYYNEGIEKQKDFADIYNNLGVCYIKMNDYKNAELNFKKSIELDEDFVDAKLNYANLILENNPKTSLDLLKSIEKKLNDSANYCNSRGQAEFLNSNFSNASFYLEKAVQKNPTNPEFLTNLGTLQYQQNKINAAEINFLKSLKLDSTNAITNNNLGLIAMQKKLPQTEKYFLNGLKYDPNNFIVLNNYTYFLIKNKILNKAEIYLEKSREIKKNNPYLLRNQGLMVIEQHKSEGIDFLEIAYQEDSSIKNIHSDIGNSYFKIKNKAKACEYWKKGKLLDEIESENNYNKYCN